MRTRENYLQLAAWGVLAGAGVGIALSGRAQETSQAPLTVWKPQPGLLRRLVRQMKVAGYALQPPQGYTAREARQASGVSCSWMGRADSKGVTPYLSLAVAPAPISNNKKMTAEQLLAGSFNNLKRGHEDWTQTAIERGQINGVPFARAYWTGTERQHKRKLRGVAYFAVDGSNAIALIGLAAAPNAKTVPPATEGTPGDPNEDPTAANADDILPSDIDRLQLAETAMQTFHRVETVKPPATPAAPTP